jgi:hypothetical protein
MTCSPASDPGAVMLASATPVCTQRKRLEANLEWVELIPLTHDPPGPKSYDLVNELGNSKIGKTHFNLGHGLFCNREER